MAEAGSHFMSRLWKGAIDTAMIHCNVFVKRKMLSETQAQHNQCQTQYRALQEELHSASQSFDIPRKKQWLQSFAKVVMDCTYQVESILVDEDFTGDDDYKLMKEILNDLGLLLTLTHVVDKDPVVTLGEDITECINWRQGALCYMYCATLYPDNSRITKDLEQFMISAEQGVKHLTAMLNTRKPLSLSRDQVYTNSEDIFELLRKNIFSDIHVLALMYAGELCYWLVKFQCKDESQIGSSIYKELGKKNLNLYLDLVNGPLKGWDGTKAQKMLSEMNV